MNLIKMALVFLKRNDLAEAIEFLRQRDEESIKILTPEDFERLIPEAPTLQDRLLVELFSETW